MSDTSYIFDFIIPVLAVGIVVACTMAVYSIAFNNSESSGKKAAALRDRTAKELAEERANLRPGSIIRIDPAHDAPFGQAQKHSINHYDPNLLQTFILKAEKSVRSSKNADRKAMTEMKRQALEELCSRSFPPAQFSSARIGQMYTAAQSYFLRNHPIFSTIGSCWDHNGSLNPTGVHRGSSNSSVTRQHPDWTLAELGKNQA